MRSFQGLSLLASVASVAFAQNTTPAGSTPSCPAYSCAGGAQATIASSLSGYAPASSLCSSSYVRPQTCSAFGATSTIRTTVATVTTQVIAQTATVTITGTTRTFTSTVSTTPSTTITVTSSVTQGTSTTSIVVIPETTFVNPNKRQVTTRSGKIILPTIAPTSASSTTSIDRQSSLLSSLRASQSSAYIAAVCTCLVKPSSTTLTSTPAVTSRVTSTVTQRVALQAQTTFYPSTTITVTVTGVRVTRTISTAVTTAFTSVTLTTTTAIATATPANVNACDPLGPGELFEGQCGPAQGPDGGCACYRDTADPARGFCASYYGDCGPSCTVNSDCAPGLDCLAESETDGICGGPTCALPSDVTDCPTTGTAVPKRSANPMAFKAIAKRARSRHSQPSGKWSGDDE